jgi:DtxR family transcriptional regulator, Mn-dependent transcriptional regulator
MSATDPPTETTQHYLREVFKLEEAGERATTTTVAAAMGVTPASASVMLKRLAGLGLVEHTPYRGVALTEAGRKVALEVIRHHRLLERYLVERLGVPLDEVHDEADRLEHALSEELEQTIDAHLGFPTHDPHGHPIPDAALRLSAPASERTLASLEPGETAAVSHIPDGDRELLRYLAGLGLVPGERVELLRKAPFAGPLTLLAAGAEHSISRELAATIGVA